MSMTYNQAADEVRKLLRGLKAVDIIASALDNAGSMENAVKEAEKALADLRRQSETVAADVAIGYEEVAKSKDEAKAVIYAAGKKADEKIAKANVKADEIIKEAEIAALQIAGKAQVASEELAKITAAIAAGNAELEVIEKKIASAKKQVASILG